MIIYHSIVLAEFQRFVMRRKDYKGNAIRLGCLILLLHGCIIQIDKLEFDEGM